MVGSSCSVRLVSPSGGSTLMTSAPRSAMIAAAEGAKIMEAASTTRMPSSGPMAGTR
jgi:hypothetical protein